MYDGRYYKIGKSKNPQNRISQIRTGNPFCELVCSGDGVTEEYLHTLFHHRRIAGEWFDLSQENLLKAKRLIYDGEKTSGNWNVSDYRVMSIAEGLKKSIQANKKYIINFGKYKGRKLISMTSDEELRYCKWFLDEKYKDISKNQKRKNRQYKAFKWWVKIGYAEYANRQDFTIFDTHYKN